MKALLLSAGIGKRLRPLTYNTPKCLMQINGKPLLEIWLEKLSKIGVNKFLINTFYLHKKVEKFINNSDYRKLVELTHEEELLGTAGTLIKNINYFLDDDCFLIHADNYCEDDLLDFIQAHKNRPKECLFSMLTFDTDKPEQSGIVETNDKGILVKFHEKILNPSSNNANGAVYILSNEFLKLLSDKDYREINDFSNQIIPDFVGKIFTFKTNRLFRDIGTIESYNFINNSFL